MVEDPQHDAGFAGCGGDRSEDLVSELLHSATGAGAYLYNQGVTPAPMGFDPSHGGKESVRQSHNKRLMNPLVHTSGCTNTGFRHQGQRALVCPLAVDSHFSRRQARRGRTCMAERLSRISVVLSAWTSPPFEQAARVPSLGTGNQLGVVLFRSSADCPQAVPLR